LETLHCIMFNTLFCTYKFEVICYLRYLVYCNNVRVLVVYIMPDSFTQTMSKYLDLLSKFGSFVFRCEIEISRNPSLQCECISCVSSPLNTRTVYSGQVSGYFHDSSSSSFYYKKSFYFQAQIFFWELHFQSLVTWVFFILYRTLYKLEIYFTSI
jgi:hypothetical protein